MTIIQSVILGIVQGLTEFLPISSSAHLTFIPKIFGWSSTSTDFDVFLHAATLLAVIIYFRNDILALIKGIFARDKAVKSSSLKIIINLVVAFIILVPFVFLLKDIISATDTNLVLVYILFIVFGIPLIFIEKYYRNNKATLQDMSCKSALLVGFSQCLALFSGVSRSGITIMTGMTQGLTKDDAKRFTFLLSIPTIAAGFAQELLKVSENFQFQESWIVIIIGSITAFICGLFAIRVMMDYLKNKSLAVFGYYRVILGIILLMTVIL